MSSDMFNLFDYCILPIIQSFMNSSPNRFGYKADTSTLLAKAIFEDTVDEYLAENSSVYACFLDMSRAFQRVKHDFLLTKMLREGIPSSLVNLANFSSSKICNSFFTRWKACRGVRQGGITSA